YAARRDAETFQQRQDEIGFAEVPGENTTLAAGINDPCGRKGARQLCHDRDTRRRRAERRIGPTVRQGGRNRATQDDNTVRCAARRVPWRETVLQRLYHQGAKRRESVDCQENRAGHQKRHSRPPEAHEQQQKSKQRDNDQQIGRQRKKAGCLGQDEEHLLFLLPLLITLLVLFVRRIEAGKFRAFFHFLHQPAFQALVLGALLRDEIHERGRDHHRTIVVGDDGVVRENRAAAAADRLVPADE